MTAGPLSVFGEATTVTLTATTGSDMTLAVDMGDDHAYDMTFLTVDEVGKICT